jgi:hypothetical protein
MSAPRSTKSIPKAALRLRLPCLKCLRAKPTSSCFINRRACQRSRLITRCAIKPYRTACFLILQQIPRCSLPSRRRQGLNINIHTRMAAPFCFRRVVGFILVLALVLEIIFVPSLVELVDIPLRDRFLSLGCNIVAAGARSVEG